MAGKTTKKATRKTKEKDGMDFALFKTKDGKEIDAATKKAVNKKIDEFMAMGEEAQVLFSWFIVVDYLGIVEVADTGDDAAVQPAAIVEPKFGGAMYG